MLRHYGERLDSVEINTTFYRTPSREAVAAWAAAVPAGFRFAVKGHRRITHNRRMPNLPLAVAAMAEMAECLGDRLGPVLFQFPPTAQFDQQRIDRIAAAVPSHWRLGFEFRNRSWHTQAVAEQLEAIGAALAHSDGEAEAGPIGRGAFVYLRLRRSSYSPQRLSAWERRIRAYLDEGRDVYVYFKHEELAPAYAIRLRDRLQTSAR